MHNVRRVQWNLRLHRTIHEAPEYLPSCIPPGPAHHGKGFGGGVALVVATTVVAVTLLHFFRFMAVIFH